MGLLSRCLQIYLWANIFYFVRRCTYHNAVCRQMECSSQKTIRSNVEQHILMYQCSWHFNRQVSSKLWQARSTPTSYNSATGFLEKLHNRHGKNSVAMYFIHIPYLRSSASSLLKSSLPLVRDWRLIYWTTDEIKPMRHPGTV